jgi:hypothetical protein
VLWRNVIDLGKGKGNLAGDWAPGREEPVGVFSNLEPEKALEIYRSRMKMEPSFRDLKGLLGLEKGMSKKLENLEKLIAFGLCGGPADRGDDPRRGLPGEKSTRPTRGFLSSSSAGSG